MSRERPTAPHRWVIVGVVAVLGVLALLFLRGPSFWQRLYYPLDHAQAIADSGARHDINPYLIAAVIDAESNWDPQRRSDAGAEGLMQVLPSTAADLAERGIVDGDRFDPEELLDSAVGIEYGTAYLRTLVDRYHEVETALAAYNAGPRHADRWAAQGGNIRDAIDFPETRHFVLRVVRARDRYEALYPEAFDGWERK